MPDNAETFRNEFISKLFQSISQDQIARIVTILDSTIAGYEISAKPVSIIPASGDPEIVKIYLASKAVENLSLGTIKLYKIRLFDFFDRVKKQYTDIKPNDIRMYLYYYKETRKSSDSYIDAIRRILNSFFCWLVKNEYLIRNPCASVEPIKFQKPERTPMTVYELEILRWNCKTIREKALIDFLFSTGIRVGECQAVNISDINWETRSVVIRHGKGNKRRTVYFNAESELTLKKYLESRTDNDDALFVSTRRPYGRIGIKALQDIVAAISKRCNMHIHPHILRHTFATCSLRGGMPLDKLQALMGHEKPETTLIYAKHDLTDLRMAHSRIYA